jgi:hypothetical protein
MRSIFEAAEILGLDDQQFHELVDKGELDGCKLSSDCSNRVRKILLDTATTETSEAHARAAFIAARTTRH